MTTTMTLEQQAAELAKLKLGALKDKLRELTGAAVNSNNRPYLIKRILKEQALRPAPPVAAAATQEAAAAKRQPRARDPRIPPAGSVLEREHDGKTIRVKVLDDGFSYKGKTYRSLSAIAKDATGTVWNGVLFFGLTSRAKKSAA